MNVGVFATILDAQGRVLLVHRRDVDVWEAPGGCVEPGESPWSAVAREVQEEVGLEVVAERVTGLYWRPLRETLVLQITCRVVGGHPKTSEEVDDHGFFPISELPHNMAPVVVDRLRDAAKPGNETVMETQEGPGARELFGHPRGRDEG